MKNIALTLIVISLFGCKDELKEIPKSVKLIHKGKEINTLLAISADEQTTGLSGTPSDKFKEDDAMLFFNLETSMRRFWMPDTYFDLDIFFLDENLKIIDVDRNVPHHPGWSNNPPIPRAKGVIARHILELRADSKVSKSIKIGDVLKMEPISPEQIEQGIRRKK
jgi:uncharacterized membrane protein (UPF0127 family)